MNHSPYHQQPHGYQQHQSFQQQNIAELESTLNRLINAYQMEQDPYRRDGINNAITIEKMKLHNAMVQVNANNRNNASLPNVSFPQFDRHETGVASDLFNKNMGNQQNAITASEPIVNNRYVRGRYDTDDLQQHKQYPTTHISDNNVVAAPVREVKYTPIHGNYYKPFVCNNATVNKKLLDNSSNYFWEIENKDLSMANTTKYFVDYDNVAITTAKVGAIASDSKVTSMMLNAKENDSKIALYNTVFTKGIIATVATADTIYQDLINTSNTIEELIVNLKLMQVENDEVATVLLDYFKTKLLAAFKLFKTTIKDVDSIFDCIELKAFNFAADVKVAVDQSIKHFIMCLKNDVGLSTDNYPLVDEVGVKFKIVNIIESTSMLYVEDPILINDFYRNVADENGEPKLNSDTQIVTLASHTALYELLTDIFKKDDNYCSAKNEMHMVLNDRGDIIEAVVIKTVNGFLIQY